MARSTVFDSLKNVLLALSTSQKRDFRKSIHIWSGGQTRYETLYDLINNELVKNPNFSYEDYLKKAAKKGDSSTKEFGTVAAYLTQKIIESARETSVIGQRRRDLYDTLENLYFLYGAELFEACQIELEKAKRLALELELPIFMLEVLYWERKLLLMLGHPDFENRVHYIAQQEQHYLTITQTRFTDFRLLAEIDGALRTNRPKDEKLNKQIDTFLSQKHKPSLITHQVAYYAIKYQLKHHLNKSTHTDTQFESLNNLIETFKQNLKFRDEDPPRYWNYLSNYCSACFRLNRLDLIEAIEPQLPQDESTIAWLKHWVYFNLLKLIKQNRFAEAAAFVKKHDLARRLVFQKSRLPQARFCINLYLAGLVLFVENDLRAADAFFKALRDHRTDESPKDSLVLASFLALVIHLELKNFDGSPVFLESEMRKTRRFLVEIGQQDEFNRQFLLAFEKMATLEKPTDRRALAQKTLDLLRPKLTEKTDDQPYKILLAWLQAHSEYRPMRDLIAEFL